MESACDLEIKLEVEEYRFEDQEIGQDMEGYFQDDNNFVSNIKTENNELEYLPINSTSNKMDEKTFINFVDGIKIEPTSSDNLMDVSSIKADAEVESDPLGPILSNCLVKKTCSSKDAINGWKSYPWHCSLCKRWPFPGYESLHEHIRTEHKETRIKTVVSYRCHDCEKSYSGYSIFLNHVRLDHHSDWKLCCDICDVRFEDYKELFNHRLAHIGRRDIVHPDVYFCFKCGRAYPTKSELHSHMELSHSNKCSICKNVYHTNVELKAHLKLEHNFVCVTCGEKFVSHYALYEHKEMHKKLRLRCEFCEDVFNTMESLNEHTKRHYLPVQFKCRYCKKEFSKKFEKEKHERIHVEGDEKEIEEIYNEYRRQWTSQGFECDICKMRFITRAGKLYHEQMHKKKDNLYQCEFCGETFSTPQNLSLHKRNHFSPVKFKCDYCEEEFPKKVEKLTHERTHISQESEEEYDCKECTIGFASVEALEEHSKKCAIAKDASYQCDLCLRSYKYFYSLKRHMNQHNEETKDKIVKKRKKGNSAPKQNDE